MGYTHYFRGWVTLNDELIADINEIIKNSTARIRNGLGEDEPIVTLDEVLINGDADEDLDHETLQLVPGVNHSNFCKTARKPYDEVVGAILLRVSAKNSRFKVSSDGNWTNGDWDEPRALYARTFGEEAVKPSEVTN
jgi:hypothetical protein